MNDNKRHGHYIHKVTYSHRERLVGAFVLTAVLALMVLLAINVTTTHVFEKRVTYHAYVNDGTGVDEDTPVRVAGIEAGRVSSLEITGNNEVHVEMFVYETFRERIRSNATATLNRLSMLGIASIEISPGSVDLPVLADGATLEIRETLSADQMMEGLAELLHQFGMDSHTSLFADLSEAAENLRLITGDLRDGKGAAGMLLYDEAFRVRMASAVDSLHEVLADATERLEQTDPLLKESSELVKHLHDASADLPALVAELRDSVGEARQVLSVVHREMEDFPDFMARADLLVRDATELVDALERIWPVSSALERSPDSGLIDPQAAHD